MTLTIDFEEILRERAERRPKFRKALLREAARCIANGQVGAGAIVLHDYVSAILGYDGLSHITGESCETLTSKLTLTDAPKTDELLVIIAAIAEHEGIELDTRALAREESADLVAA